MLVAGELLVERRLMRGREALTAVLPRYADTGEPGVEEAPLDLAVMRDVGQLLLLGNELERADHALRRCGAEVRTDPRSGSRPERLDVFDLWLAHWCAPSSTMSAIRCRCSAGVPSSARSTVSRRTNKCRSCSNVTPIPPCICTQSCTSSAP